MIKKITAILFATFFSVVTVFSQELVPTPLTSNLCGQSETLTIGSLLLVSDGNGANGNYSPNQNCSYSVVGSCNEPYRMSVRINSIDIDPGDTLFLYDGPAVFPATLIAAINNSNSTDHEGRQYYASTANSSNTLTVRFRSNSDNNTGAGFSMTFSCAYPCEASIPVIEDTYDVVRNGVVVGTNRLRDNVAYDTIVRVINGVPETTYNVAHFKSANICDGECVKLHAHGQYSHDNGLYNPSDATTLFRWNFGGSDTLSGINLVRTRPICYDSASCYYVRLSLLDEMNCASINEATMYIRIAPNPIKSIGDLPVICANDSIFVNISTEEGSAVSYNHIEIESTHSGNNSSKQFVPDGLNHCEVSCYSSKVVFNEFSNDMVVTSAEDICSVCVNFEHSYMGDYQLSIKCPTDAEAILKYKNSATGIPEGAYGGGGTFTGYPYGGSDHDDYDCGGISYGAPDNYYCDSVYNMYGVGLDYCFSRNGAYTLVDGYPANTITTMASHYIAATDNAYQIDVTHTFETIPRPFVNAGTSAGTKTFKTKRPSDRATKSDYYLPAQSFSNLIGCPLNGEWEVSVCDWLGVDNGWIFGWSMDLCNAQLDNYNCKYEVPIDTAYWSVDSLEGHWDRGVYHGLHVNSIGGDDYAAYVSTIDTGGTFNLYFNLIDDYGCHWDTSMVVMTNPLPTSVTVVNKCPYETYTWVDGNSYIDAPTPRPSWIFPAQTGCDSVVSLQIVNDRVPEAHINVVPSYVSYNNTEVTLYDVSQGSYSREWYFGDERSNSAIATFTYPIEKDSLEVMLIAMSEFNCPDTAFITIPMDKTLIWTSTTAFTPDRDDNDKFFFKAYNVLDDAQVYIYNRMGALVSSWVGFEGMWDGHHNGKRCPMGAYTWVVKYHSSFEPSRWHYKTGTVTLLR